MVIWGGEQAAMFINPLNLVVRHVVLNVVFKRERIRSMSGEREVDFDTGAVLWDTLEAIVKWVYNAEPANLKTEMVTHISDDCSVAIGGMYPQFPASVRLIFDAPDGIQWTKKPHSAIVVSFSQSFPPVELFDFSNESLEAIIAYIVRTFTEGNLVEFGILSGVTCIARQGRTSARGSCVLVTGTRRLSAGTICLLGVVWIGILGHWYLTENHQSRRVTGFPARTGATVDQASISTDVWLL
jgi:hypothetical protein